MVVRLSPAVRIIPPSDVPGTDWIAEHLLQRRRYRLSTAAAAALVASSRPQDPERLIERLELMTRVLSDGVSLVANWEGVVETLKSRELIIDASLVQEDSGLAWLINLRRTWSRFGWHEAADYHTLSFDYPCVDYSQATAILIDRSRMRDYQADDPDIDRFKLDYLDRPEVGLPGPTAEMSTGTAHSVWNAAEAPRSVNGSTIETVISLAFGKTGSIVPRTNSAPLLRRSSPSGGARNPSEGYVIIREVPGIATGWYHVTMEPFGLRKLDLPLDDEGLGRLFPNTLGRFPYRTKALVVITSVFERNMYRYREPRTFRTVHMDAGHIAGSLRLTARSLGLTAGIFYCDAATRIEEALGLDGMQEGYMLTVAIADGIGETGHEPRVLERTERMAG